jgi:hypothetical protein
MFIWVFIDEAIGTTGRDSGREDTLSFGSSPVAWLFALAEGFDGTGGQRGLSSLGNALLAFATVSTASVPTARAGRRRIGSAAPVRMGIRAPPTTITVPITITVTVSTTTSGSTNA